MPAFVVLLRGVNVGNGKRVPMAELRSMLQDLGYSNVSTLLNSGNAVFTAKQKSVANHATNIQKLIAERLGIDVPVVVKSASELNAIVEGNSLTGKNVDPSRLLVIFSQTVAALSATAKMEGLVEPPERFLLGKEAAYLLCAKGILQSKAGAALLGKGGQSITTRNWATVLKLRAMTQ